MYIEFIYTCIIFIYERKEGMNERKKKKKNSKYGK